MARASSNCSLATSCDTMPLFSLVLPSKLVSSANDGSAEAVGVAARRATGLATGTLAKPPNMSSLLAGAAVTVTGVAAANEPNASELAGCAVAAVVVGALSNPPNISSLDGATQPYTHQTMTHTHSTTYQVTRLRRMPRNRRRPTSVLLPELTTSQTHRAWLALVAIEVVPLVPQSWMADHWLRTLFFLIKQTLLRKITKKKKPFAACSAANFAAASASALAFSLASCVGFVLFYFF